jgi:hypothetical protein
MISVLESRPVGCRGRFDHDGAMSNPTFKRLNDTWNAEPNAPAPRVAVSGTSVRLTFILNPWAYEAKEEEEGCLTFQHCSAWRLGATNDEGWFAGQCRYSNVAPAWGEFYELLDEDDQRLKPTDWHELGPLTSEQRHFLFYLRVLRYRVDIRARRFSSGGVSVTLIMRSTSCASASSHENWPGSHKPCFDDYFEVFPRLLR